MQTFIGVALRQAQGDHDKVRNDWADGYVPLVRDLPGLRAYRWNGAGDRFARDTDARFDPLPILGFSQFAFETGVSIEAVLSSRAGKALMEYERATLTRHLVLDVEERLVIDPPPSPLTPGAVKTMSIVHRSDDLDVDGFLHEWRVVHVPLVRAIKQMKGYRQSRIRQALDNWVTPVGYAEFPFDGAVELWQGSLEDAQAMAATPEAQVAFAHAARTSARIEKFQIHDILEWNAV